MFDSKYEEEKQSPVKSNKEQAISFASLMSIEPQDAKQQLTVSLGLDTLKEKIGRLHNFLINLSEMPYLLIPFMNLW